MKVFLSWSAERSKQVAKALEAWLPQVIQSVDPFMSDTMDAGVKWNEVVAQNLADHDIGILCVTSENVGRPWLNYEAGALAHRFNDRSRLIPYLLGFASPNDLGPPLNQFNVVLADQEGTWKLVKTLDGLDERPRATPELKEAFDSYWWPRLQTQLEAITGSTAQPAPSRTDGDKLDELLEIGRQLLRRGNPSELGAWMSETTLGKTRAADRTTLRLRDPSDPARARVVDPGLGRVALEAARWLQRQGLVVGEDENQGSEGSGDASRGGSVGRPSDATETGPGV